MKIRHLVHSCLLVETAGRTILIDPGGFSGQAVRDLPTDVLTGIDIIAVTHQHPDHLDPVLLADLLAASPQAVVIAEPETAAQLGETSPEERGAGDGDAVADPPVGLGQLMPLAAGAAHEFDAVGGNAPLRIAAVGGHHAIIHPDIPRVGNIGLVLSAGDGPRLGVTGGSLEPPQEFHGIDSLALVGIAPRSRAGRRWLRPSMSCARSGRSWPCRCTTRSPATSAGPSTCARPPLSPRRARRCGTGPRIAWSRSPEGRGAEPSPSGGARP